MEAFRGCENVTSVHLPDSVTTIGDSAFENCRNLARIVVPASVQFIDLDAFKSCKKLTIHTTSCFNLVAHYAKAFHLNIEFTQD